LLKKIKKMSKEPKQKDEIESFFEPDFPSLDEKPMLSKKNALSSQIAEVKAV
jgi:hypothetical protein